MSSKGMVSVAVVFMTMGGVLFLATPAARASVLYWYYTDGGCWETDINWTTDTSGNGATTWTPGDDANFYVPSSDPAGSTITISNSVSPVTVGNITFTGSGYTVSGGSLEVAGTITTLQNATISSVLVGGNGLTTAGSAQLTFGGSYSGATSITAGTLQLAASLSATTPVVHYTFDGTVGYAPPTGAAILDASGNGNNATVTESGGIYVAGRFAQGIKVPPAGWITCPANSTINGFSAWTDSLWCSISSTASNAYLVACCNNNSNTGFMETYSPTTSCFTAAIQAAGGQSTGWLTQSATCACSLPLNTWHMVTYAVDSTGYSIYVDGVLGASGTLSGPPEFGDGTGALNVGGHNYYPSRYLSVDDFQLYDSVLTAAQINSLYLTGASAYGALPTTSPVQIASGATLDLGGASQTVAGLSDLSGGGGAVTDSTSAAPTLTVAPAGGSATFSGVIQDGAGKTSLILNGPGTQVLAGSNTYSGPTTITAGTLQVGTGGTTGSIGGTSAIVDNGVLAFDRSDKVTLAFPISGSGRVTQMGPGTLVLNSSNSYTGVTTISSGVLQLPFSSILAYYKFDGDLSDSSGNGNTGTPGGTGAIGYSATAKSGSSLVLTGSNWVFVPASPSLVGTGTGYNNFTVSAWINASSLTSGTNGITNGIFSTCFGSENITFNMYLSGGTAISYNIGSGTTHNTTGRITLASSLTTNTWYMITCAVLQRPVRGLLCQRRLGGFCDADCHPAVHGIGRVDGNRLSWQ